MTTESATVSTMSSPSSAVPPTPDPNLIESAETRPCVDSSDPDPDPSSSSSSNEDERRSRSRTRQPRPHYLSRESSTSFLVPRDHPHIDLDLEIGPNEFRKQHSFAPDDARAMSPRRSGSDIAKLGENVRESLVAQARTLQSSLAALAERIEIVRNDHVKLEKENKLLQDYIGGLTRNMAAAGTTSSSSLGKGRK